MTIELTLAAENEEGKKVLLCWGPGCWASPGSQGGTAVFLHGVGVKMVVQESYVEVKEKLAHAYSVEWYGWLGTDERAPGIEPLPDPADCAVH